MTGLFLSCEHGGNQVPPELQHCFAGHEDVLGTHRGHDIGALDLFHRLVPLAAASKFTTLSRLCIEMNRSEGHRQLFSAFTQELGPGPKQHLLALYRSYREAITGDIQARIAAGTTVLHVAVHSFTPVLDGVVRTVDIGLLYDPARAAERALCRKWSGAIQRRRPGLVVRMNQPYKGVSDGLPTALRKVFPTHYAGVELEVNQRFASHNRMDRQLASVLHDSLAEVLAQGW
ncbi:MAG: N-formylglutamate amidohydrolase [Flavobacteriales bacterium]|nr:N-formylglutamate amidohydrolase [Flavobacteriales bacterium]MBP9080214.1 N-formylglutamate amidohydrolase [Flavobacteriales bacterium]